MTRAPDTLTTARLVLRRPHQSDAAAVFERYASDPEVTRYLGWPRHQSLDDTRAFITFSDAEWARWPAGPYLVHRCADGRLVGSTGLAFETPWRAATGYVFARDAWGQGYAGEVLAAMCALAGQLGVRRLYALCHPDHAASRRVLERGGFSYEGRLAAYAPFPNLAGDEPLDCVCYGIRCEAAREGD